MKDQILDCETEIERHEKYSLESCTQYVHLYVGSYETMGVILPEQLEPRILVRNLSSYNITVDAEHMEVNIQVNIYEITVG